MDKETADSWAEQQAREIKNLKAMRKSERDRIIKIVKTYPVGKYSIFKCTSCEDFPQFINNWVHDLIQHIKSEGTKSDLTKV